MADYHTSFSCIFDVGNAANAARAKDIRRELEAEKERNGGEALGFEMEPDPALGAGGLWIHSDSGEPDHVIGFVLLCADAFDLRGRWGFLWSDGCSKPRLDGYGGGAHVIDLGRRRSIAWLDCAHWLGQRLAPRPRRRRAAVVPTTAGGAEGGR